MSGKKYTILCYPGGLNAVKTLIVAHLGGLEDEVDYPSDFKMGVDNKSPEYLKNVNPTGQVPALKTPEGNLFESNAMAMYFAHKVGKNLLGKDSMEFGLINQWIDFFNNHIKTPLGAWFMPYVYAFAKYDEVQEKTSVAALKGSAGKDPLGILDRHLAGRTYIVGEQVTMADVILFVGLVPLFTIVGVPSFLADLPNLTKWATELAKNPAFHKGLAAIGKEFKLAEKAPEPVAK